MRAWGVGATPDGDGPRQLVVAAAARPRVAWRRTMWHAVARAMSAAALASAMTNPQVTAMILNDRLERERHER
ncbi:MAG: hypothetical protein ACREN2_10560 [Candidatus Dormibacteria bacterium]